ncbi:hypothetical protein GOARA_082_00020 [Gordonia araii NBRC 100433]|uniref:Uncharacterized protein n=1 Tax=Gordonia araii NBRC 100433 TaxID=1073574 RepID=G7H6Z0_9ACTN|nr:hypothetical protein [Gordonia araii]NNG97611.1 hypothetical protein [Gordonia araii NBRC 100433]GAB11615.1 hypothetical protein GOARA_082_00020 [Gordonia araii NBRC 100433]
MSTPNTDTDVITVVGPDDRATIPEPQSPVEPATPVTPGGSAEPAANSGVPTATLVAWLAGCVLLVVSAVALPRLSEWAGRYGSIPVFLGFFLVMSLAGRWFWAGTDAIISAIRGKA